IKKYGIANSIAGTPHLRPYGCGSHQAGYWSACTDAENFGYGRFQCRASGSRSRSSPSHKQLRRGDALKSDLEGLPRVARWKEYPPLSPGYGEALTGGKPETFSVSESECSVDLSLLFTVWRLLDGCLELPDRSVCAGIVDLLCGALGYRSKRVGAGDRLCPRTRCGQRSEEHTSELQSRFDLVCRLLLEKKNPLHRPRP